MFGLPSPLPVPLSSRGREQVPVADSPRRASSELPACPQAAQGKSSVETTRGIGGIAVWAKRWGLYDGAMRKSRQEAMRSREGCSTGHKQTCKFRLPAPGFLLYDT